MSSCCGQTKKSGSAETSCCGSNNVTIFSCSGGSRIGQVANDSAVLLKNLGAGKMSCITCISLLMNNHIDNAQNAKCVVAIDGCKVGCVKQSLDKAGIEKYKHFLVTDLGITNQSDNVDDRSDVVKMANHIAVELRKDGLIE